MTAIGTLNRRLVLQQSVEMSDGTGGVMRTYAFVARLWARVERVSARHSVEADVPGATVTHRITIRKHAAVTTRHRLVEGSAVYRIVSLREDDTRCFLVIGAEQRSD